MTPRHPLIIAPHPDDAELGMGGTIARLADGSSEPTILMLSDRGEQSWLDEARAAARILHGSVTVETLHLTVFHMATERATLLRHLEEYRRKLKPDAVFVPAAGDTHQDHTAALEECRRAFKGLSLYGYEISRSNVLFRPTLFVPIHETYVDQKCDAVQCYAPQRDKLYCQPAAIKGLATARGAMCDSRFAEAFQTEWEVWTI